MYWVPSWNLWAQFLRNLPKISTAVQKVKNFDFEHQSPGWTNPPVLTRTERVAQPFIRCHLKPQIGSETEVETPSLTRMHLGLWTREGLSLCRERKTAQALQPNVSDTGWTQLSRGRGLHWTGGNEIKEMQNRVDEGKCFCGKLSITEAG